MRLPSAVVFDLDGTLAESKQPLSSDMAALLERLLQKAPVAVMSGGSWPQFQTQFLPAFSLSANLSNLYLFPTSAAQCYVREGDSWVARYDNSFSQEERGRVTSALKGALASSGFVQPQKLWGEQIEDRGAEITFSALGQEAPIEEKKNWDPDRSKRMPLFRALTAALPDFSVAVNATTSIDITRKGINKAYGVRRLAEMLSVPVASIIYVGDALQEGGNDAVVIGTGVQTHPVSDPADTAAFISTLLRK